MKPFQKEPQSLLFRLVIVPLPVILRPGSLIPEPQPTTDTC